MALLLTTPFEQPAMHGESAETYNEVKIIVVGIDLVQKQLSITCQYGNTVSGDWANGLAPVVGHVISNKDPVVDGNGVQIEPADPAYDVFMASAFAESTTSFLYNEVADTLYQWLIDQGIYTGTIT